MFRILALMTALASPALANPAFAGVSETVERHILPGYARFAEASQTLAKGAAQSCEKAALRPLYQEAFDAWMGVQHLRFGPVEQGGRALSIAFWPDSRGSGRRTQMALLTGDPALLTPERFGNQSVAARGFFALERLLYPKAPLPADPCALIRATARNLALVATDISAEWGEGYADTLLSAGEAENTTYLSQFEARQVLFTQLATSLEFTDDNRLGRPLGTFERPRPSLAEAVPSGRSLRNVRLSLEAQRAMVETLVPKATKTLAGFDRAIALAQDLEDPVFAGVTEPQGRLKVEILQQAVDALRLLVLSEVGPELGVSVGFNAADGD